MQLTSNYNLKKPDGTDVVNITDFNDNADIIDTQLKKLNDGKVDKVTGKQLSTNDYTAAEKTKLAGIATSANNYTHPANHPASIITQDASNRFVTDAEKSAWNAKETTTGAQTKANTAESNAKNYTNQHSIDDIAHNRYGTATGTNALVATLTPAPSKLVAGFTLRFKNTTANTGTVTLNVNGLGAKPIVKNGGVALSAGNLKVSGVYTVCYDGTNFILQGEGGEYGTAVASNVLSGKTIGTDNGLINGTMVNRGNVGTQNLTGKGASYTIPKGFHDGNGKVTATYDSTSEGRVENIISLPAASQVYIPHPWGGGTGVSPYNASTASVFITGMQENYFDTAVTFGNLYRPGSPYSNSVYLPASNFSVTMDNSNIRFFANTAGTFRYLITRMPREWM